MNKNYFIFGLISLMLSISGCSNSKLLKEVDNIALVSIRFEQEIKNVSKKQFQRGDVSDTEINAGKALSLLNKATKEKSKTLNTLVKAVEGKEKQYFDEITKKLVSRIDQSSLTVVSVDSFKDNRFYLNPENFKTGPEILEKLNYYTPNPYKFHDLNTNVITIKKSESPNLKDGKRKAIALAKELNVDAVAAFNFQFVNIKSKRFFIIPNTQLGVIAHLIVRNKDGKKIFNKTIKVKSSKNFDLSLDFAGLTTFQLNEKTQKQYQEIEELFFNQIDQLIAKAPNS